jgi:hypothetical protein
MRSSGSTRESSGPGHACVNLWNFIEVSHPKPRQSSKIAAFAKSQPLNWVQRIFKMKLVFPDNSETAAAETTESYKMKIAPMLLSNQARVIGSG